jgi:hypothetical protein
MNEEAKITEEDADPISPEICSRANKVIILMPEDWIAPKHIYPSTTESLAKIFRSESAPVEVLDSGPLALRDSRSTDWIAPTFFVSSMLLSENPTAVTVALGILSNYVYDAFRGLKKDPTVKINLVHNDTLTGTTKKVRYEGPVSGLNQLEKIASKWAPAKK